MKVISRMELKPGMELGEDVENNGQILFKAGTIVDEHVINRVNRYNIFCVTVLEAVDYATTHYEKIQFDEEFKAFVSTYKNCLNKYKGIMLSYLGTKSTIKRESLLEVYDECYTAIKDGKQLLDFLYNMMPSDDEMTYSQCLSSALLCGTFADWLDLPPDEKKILILCGFYYDIGKWNIPMEILWKPGKLTDTEFAMVKKHPIIGYSIIKNDYNLNEHIKNAVIMHHERMDASGYPFHMTGDKIDKYARIMAIVDTYIAMASPRTFRNAFTPLQILNTFEKSIEKYDKNLLEPIMARICEAQIGTTVLLSDDSTWTVVMKNPYNYSRPILKDKAGNLLDLSGSTLEITKML